MKASVVELTYISSSKQEKEFLDLFKEEMIRAECSPRCGGCQCGHCATGSKQMSLKEEKELEHFESLMYLEEQGTVMDPRPYWVTKQPWKVSKETLVDNKPAVLGVMNSTKAKLNRKPDWRAVYEK